MAEETAAEGKTLRTTTGDTNKEAKVEETQRRDGHAQDEDTEEGEKTGVGVGSGGRREALLQAECANTWGRGPGGGEGRSGKGAGR